jgi:hypothetical protein
MIDILLSFRRRRNLFVSLKVSKKIPPIVGMTIMTNKANCLKQETPYGTPKWL